MTVGLCAAFFLRANIRQVVDDPDEDAFLSDHAFADGEIHRKNRAVFAPPLHLASYPDDARIARPAVTVDVAVVLGPVWLGHQHVHIA